MAKAKKLPSGTWRVQVYSHTDSDGKKHYESFSAPTKAEAEMKAAEYAANKHRRVRHDMTVKEAIEGYINAKEGVLSPGTIRGYARYTHHYKPLEHRKVRSLTSEDLQIFVSDLAREHSPKTVKNAYSLLHASLSLYAPDMSFNVTLPTIPKRRPTSPSDEDVRALYEAAAPAMKIAIGFAMCGLREGEISGLKYEDIENGVAYVHAVIVKDRNAQWIYKELPKTIQSDRYVLLPSFLVDAIGEGEGFVTGMNPATISKKFTVLRDKLGQKTRIHDLRHYFASTASLMGIPDIYIADMGGWDRNSSVLKRVYENNMSVASDHFWQMMASHMDKIVSHEVSHENDESP